MGRIITIGVTNRADLVAFIDFYSLLHFRYNLIKMGVDSVNLVTCGQGMFNLHDIAPSKAAVVIHGVEPTISASEDRVAQFTTYIFASMIFVIIRVQFEKSLSKAVSTLWFHGHIPVVSHFTTLDTAASRTTNTQHNNQTQSKHTQPLSHHSHSFLLAQPELVPLKAGLIWFWVNELPSFLYH